MHSSSKRSSEVAVSIRSEGMKKKKPLLYEIVLMTETRILKVNQQKKNVKFVGFHLTDEVRIDKLI